VLLNVLPGLEPPVEVSVPLSELRNGERQPTAAHQQLWATGPGQAPICTSAVACPPPVDGAACMGGANVCERRPLTPLLCALSINKVDT